MIEDRMSGPKPDALPGCATPRLALSLGKPEIERNPSMPFRGNDGQNMAGTGDETPGIVPNSDAGTKNQPHPRKPAPVIAESAIDPQAKVSDLGEDCRRDLFAGGLFDDDPDMDAECGTWCGEAA